MKTYEAHLKTDWTRAEYLEAQKRMAHIENRAHLPFIFCSHCKKEVKSLMIHVVNFGKEVACDSCFNKKWAKMRDRIAKFAIPKALEDNFEESIDSPELQQQQAQDAKELKRAHDECIAGIRRPHTNNQG